MEEGLVEVGFEDEGLEATVSTSVCTGLSLVDKPVSSSLDLMTCTISRTTDGTSY